MPKKKKSPTHVTCTQMAAQGDVLFRRVGALPEGLERVTGPVVVAHSETGHHHSIDVTDGVAMFRDPRDPLVCYLTLEGVEHADVVHHRSFDTHATLRLVGDLVARTVWQVRRQREWTPAGLRRVED